MTYGFQHGAPFDSPESIVISKDSFYLRGNGAHFIADTNYRGPAFIISVHAKHIVLDSLVFENFDVALADSKEQY